MMVAVIGSIESCAQRTTSHGERIDADAVVREES